MTRHLTAALILLMFALAGCGGDEHAGHDHAGDSHDEAADERDAHAHEAPRGGALLVLAEETAHLEMTFEPGTGTVSLYALGAHATQPVRLADPELKLFLYRGGEAIRLILQPVASELTGETVGDTSHFRGTDDRLVGAETFNGHIQDVTSRGVKYEQVKFRWPPE